MDFSREPRSAASGLFLESMLQHEAPATTQLAPIQETVGFAKSSFGQGSLLSGVFTLVASAMGAGCLSLPHMLQQSGLLLGLGLLAFGAILAHMSLVVLMSCARYTRCRSFAELVALCQSGGKRGGGTGVGDSRMLLVVDTVIALYGVAAVLIYMMLIGDFLGGIVEAPLFPRRFANVSRGSLILGSLLIVLPLSLPRQVSALRHVCFLSTSSILAMSLVVLWRVQDRSSLRAEESGELQLVAGGLRTTLKSFAIAIFAFAAHTNAVPTVVSLQDARSSSIWKVSLLSVFLEFVVYAIIATSGYLTFSGATKQDFIRNYPADDWLMLAVRCVYSVPVVFGVPINLSPAAASLQSLVRRTLATEGGSTAFLRRWLCSEGLLHVVTVTAVLGFCAVLAIWSEAIADVIGLLGSFFGTLICLWWPRKIYNSVLKCLHHDVLAVLMNGSLSVASGLGATAFLLQAWEVFAAGRE